MRGEEVEGWLRRAGVLVRGMVLYQFAILITLMVNGALVGAWEEVEGWLRRGRGVAGEMDGWQC